MSSPLHLIDGAGAIKAPLEVARYLAEVLGADPSTLPDAAAPAAGSAVPSISVLHERGMNYRVVAVFGGQGTGKSTLLNHLFGTRFATMNSAQGRSQTTKGCFLGNAIQNPDAELTGDLLVMDFEGTDGVERGENQNFEKQLSLFALTVADTLIVNMFASEVGRFNAANLSLLQAVFQVNLQLLSHEPPVSTIAKVTLLFVLRDHTDCPLQKLQDGIVRSLDVIWSTIHKPASFADSNIRDFFNMSFCTLPHFDLQRPQFDEAVDGLRRWFWDDRCPSYLYTGVAQDNYRHIALEDVADYLANCWHSIQTEKDLNLPTQREFVAIARCRDVSKALVSEHTVEISKRERELGIHIFTPNISGWIHRDISKRLAKFALKTGHYVSTITQQAAADLKGQLERNAHSLYETQCKNLCDALAKNEVQQVLIAARSDLRRLSTEWFTQIQASRNTRFVRVPDAPRRVKTASGAVNKFWGRIKAELEAVHKKLQNQIATANANKDEVLLHSLHDDANATQRCIELLRSRLDLQLLSQVNDIASMLSDSMKDAFIQHVSKNVDGALRYLMTDKSLRKAFVRARACGLLLAACVTVCRLPADHADPDVAALLRTWAADAMQLEFDMDETSVGLISAPVYPKPPLRANRADETAWFIFEQRVIVNQDCLERSTRTYSEECAETFWRLTEARAREQARLMSALKWIVPSFLLIVAMIAYFIIEWQAADAKYSPRRVAEVAAISSP